MTVLSSLEFTINEFRKLADEKRVDQFMFKLTTNEVITVKVETVSEGLILGTVQTSDHPIMVQTEQIVWAMPVLT